MTSATADPLRGRGARRNPANRFERLAVEPDEAVDPAELPRPETVFLRDASRTVITYNQSPDVGFDASLNPYRGCEHGCSYCYARPFHEYLGFSSGLDFETRIVVKEEAPQLLARELGAPRWRPQVLALSGVTDPYQPVERKLGITRGCLEVLAAHRNPVGIVTKNHLVTRDADLLADLAAHRAAAVSLSVTTLDPELARRLEPRASAPQRRLAAITALAAAGVPVHAMVAPVIPAINDHEIPSILAAVAAAGATSASYVLLRLPHAVKELFADWLERHYPERRDKVLGRLRQLRGGRLNDPDFKTRMRGEGVHAEQIGDLFRVAAKKAGLDRKIGPLSTAAFRRPGEQLRLFGAPAPP